MEGGRPTFRHHLHAFQSSPLTYDVMYRMPCIWNLKLPLNKKLRLVVMFSAGVLCVAPFPQPLTTPTILFSTYITCVVVLLACFAGANYNSFAAQYLHRQPHPRLGTKQDRMDGSGV